MEVTLDTSAVREFWDDRASADAVQRLVELAQQEKIDLAVTARIHEDIPDDPLASRLSKLPDLAISEIGSATRLGYWVLGRDMLGAEGFDAQLGEMQILARERLARPKRGTPPDWRDWDHLHAHMLSSRDLFVTLDKGLLSVAPELEQRFQIHVLTPAEALVRLGDWRIDTTDIR